PNFIEWRPLIQLRLSVNVKLLDCCAPSRAWPTPLNPVPSEKVKAGNPPTLSGALPRFRPFRPSVAIAARPSMENLSSLVQRLMPKRNSLNACELTEKLSARIGLRLRTMKSSLPSSVGLRYGRSFQLKRP